MRNSFIIIKEITSADSVYMYDLFEYPIDEALAQRLVRSFHARMKKRDSLVLGIYSIREERLAGVIEAYDLQDDGSLSIGYRVCPPMREKGYGSAAVQLFSEWLLAHGVRRIDASAKKTNTSSCRILAKSGFAEIREERGHIIFNKYQ